MDSQATVAQVVGLDSEVLELHGSPGFISWSAWNIQGTWMCTHDLSWLKASGGDYGVRESFSLKKFKKKF